MASRSKIDANRGLPPAFSMWKTFHSTVTMLFRNLENAHNNLQSFANTILGSAHFSDIFTPSYDHSLSFEANQLLEKKYKVFTTWFLGRLFYILSYEKYASIHELYIKAQLKILNILRINQPHIYNVMIAEYNTALYQLNSYLEVKYSQPIEMIQPPLTLNVFDSDTNVIKRKDLELSPKFVEIISVNSCVSLQYNILRILTHAHRRFIDSYWMDKLSQSILNNVIENLIYADLKGKLIVLEYFVELLESHYCQFKNCHKLYKYHGNVVLSLEFFIEMFNDQYGKDDVQQFEKVFCKLINIAIEYKIIHDDINLRTKYRQVCECVYQHILKNTSVAHEHRTVVQGCMLLIKEVMNIEETFYPNIKFLLEYVHSRRQCTDADVLLENQMFCELKRYAQQERFLIALTVYLDEKSDTWRVLFDDFLTLLKSVDYNNSIRDVEAILQYGQNLFEMVQRVYGTFHHWFFDNHPCMYCSVHVLRTADILYHIVSVINHAKIDSSPEKIRCLDMIVEIFRCVLSFHSFAANKLVHFKSMIEIILYPFKDGITVPNTHNVPFLTIDRMTPETRVEKQMRSLYILSTCVTEPTSISEKWTILTYWLPAMYKYCLTIPNNRILTQVAKCIPHALCSSKILRKAMYKILFQLFVCNNSEILKVLSDQLGIIICILCGKYVKIWEIHDQTVKFEVQCMDCDFTMGEINQTLRSSTLYYRKGNNEKYAEYRFFKSEEIVDDNFLPAIMNLMRSEIVVVRRNFARHLLKCLKHIFEFDAKEVTEQWLHLLTDKDQGVRLNLVESVRLMVQYCQKVGYWKYLTDCLSIIKDRTEKYLLSVNAEYLETILAIIKEIGCVTHYKIIYAATKLLLSYLMLGGKKVRAISIDYLHDIAKARGLQPNMLYIRYKNQMCRTVVGMSVISYCQRKSKFVQTLEKMSLAFQVPKNDLIARDCHHFLPYFIPLFVKIPQCKPMLADIAGFMCVGPAELIISNFSYIYTHIYLNEDRKTFNDCMQFVEQITHTTISVLRRRTIKIIHNELLMHCHDKRELVMEELHELSKEEPNRPDITAAATKEEAISSYLHSRFLGVLVYFDAKLISKNVSESIKKRVLASLPELIKIMGPRYITTVRIKVLNTLRTASALVEYQYLELVSNCWDAFVRGCEIESLGPLLSTIFVSLLPLNRIYSMDITRIMSYLIIENEEKMKDNIPDLFILPREELAPSIVKVIKRHVNDDDSDWETYKEQFTSILKYINSKNLEVRVHGLNYFKNFLMSSKDELKKMILANDHIHPLVVQLKDTLMQGCKEHDEKVRLACAECIGVIGAIEPSKFPRVYTQQDEIFPFYITEDAFVVEGLTELLRSFQVEKNTQNMNRFALAIQEILKSYSIAPNKFGQKNELWSKFSPYMQELMLPLLSSRYTISLQSNVVLTHPICTSNLGATFTDWVDYWMMFLIKIMKNEKSSLLQECRPCFKQDYRTLMYFLPRILIHSIIECTNEERTLIHNEFMAVLTAPSGFRGLKSKSFDHRYMKSPQYVVTDITKESDTVNQHSHVTVIFVLLDYLDRWLREYERVKYQGRIMTNSPSMEHYRILKDFMNQFCKLRIAKCNYMRDEYPRALMYLEEYIERDKTKLTEQLGFLAQIYIKLDDPDGPYGVMALKETELTQEDMILRHTITGQYQDAAACYEQVAHQGKLSPKHIKNMIECYQYLDNPYTTLILTTGEVSSHNIDRHKLSEIEAESYWRMGMFNKLSVMLQRPDMKGNTSWGVRIGQALLYFREGNNKFVDELRWIRKLLIAKLSDTSLDMGMYGHGYGYIIKLHILNELEDAETATFRINICANDKISLKLINTLLEEWDMRLKLIQPTVSVMEAVLRFRRITLQQMLHVLKPQYEAVRKILNDLIGNYWLMSAKIARKANVCTQAYNYVLYAEKYQPVGLFIEKAKLCWQKLDHELAFTTLKRGIEKHFPDAATFRDMDPTERKAERQMCAQAKLLIATYNEETSNVDMEVNIAHYKDAVDMCREWDKSLLCLAQYYEKVFYTMDEETRDKVGADILIHIINCFGKSLIYGTNHIYQSMPRMLSMWFDFGTRMVENKEKDTETVQKHKYSTLLKMIRLIDTFLDRLPAYMFLSAFSQLVSRICHPVREVYLQIKTIVIKLILKYPQQCMWRILAVSKSSYAVRTKRCQEVLQDSRLKNSNVMKLIYDFNRIADKLIELCNKPLSEAIVKSSINTLLRALPKLLQSKEFSQIMLPTQKLLKLVLPNPVCDNPEFTPFPNTCVYISKIEDEIIILSSLQRPRKITLIGTDGKKYIHMLKPKDDLRKDFRLMEFNDIVNNYLHVNPESRARRLCIRTYSVVPLNEECGIVEWVNNLVGLRPVLVKIYKQKELFVGTRELKSMICSRQDSLARKRQVFLEQLIPKHPPVLAEWFRQTFPDAHFWYQARNAYVRTCAVMSMVGYILGLGDRHGENILFDTTNGDTVHVDFNCLFNKGEQFEWSERVPFRLTHNMVDAMGPMGVEGTFRRSCEITLRILREHIDTLMSVLRPFVYDPLMSWPRHHVTRADDDPEKRNDQAVVHVRNIELRLQGMINIKGKGFSISLSPEGQANNLILEATNVDNLCQMYVGWGPFM